MFIGFNLYRKIFLFLPAFVFLWPSSGSPREVTLTLLFTGDHRGQLDPLHPGDGSPVGGVSRRMALIEKIRQEVGPDHVALVDSGDLFEGSAFSELTQGKADCEAYHLMGYDGICLGEHDLDYGREVFGEYRKDFKVPWVAANVNRGGQPFMRAYILKAMGVRVGLIGFANPDTPSLVGRESTQGLVFNPPGLVAKGLHSIFKKDADLFVALTRMNLADSEKFAKDNPFLHVVIASHGKTPLKQPIINRLKDGTLKGPLVCQSVPQGLYLGRLDLTLEGHRDPKTRTSTYVITDYRYQMIPITADLPEDPKMNDLLQSYKSSLKANPLDEVLASAADDISMKGQADFLLGEMTADAIRQKARTEVALVDDGSFRLDFKTGDVTREVLYEIYPFDHQIVVMDLPGSYLRKILGTAADKKGESAFLQISGLKVSKGGGGVDVTVGGDPLNDRRKYLVAVSDFLAGGGEGYDLFRRVKSRRKTGWMIRGLIESALKVKQKLSSDQLEKRWELSH